LEGKRSSELASASCPALSGKHRLKFGENWFRFVKRPHSKHISISIEALILRGAIQALLRKLLLLVSIRRKITQIQWLTECDFGGAALPRQSEVFWSPRRFDALSRACSRAR
jgi:hypothetical protein